MPKRFRMTRRFPAAMTEDGYRKLTRFADDAGLNRAEALSFMFENLDKLLDADEVPSRLRKFKLTMDGGKL
ncbi:hypothetical protein FHS72_002154 [Loktanella ponticola]|uniref:CopG family transcriptional regulator n=1 Tax=Yoonia ponticola TaxID=1524255 RepID=A0A7W9EY92_9RHOB|nr:hypothetical protein [Yoonia ponticola]MBB5722528.1 hypothetical protein [Yoonia ponticola]